MKPSLVIAALLVAFPALADEPKPWPQKGDTVFVAAALAGFNPATTLGVKMPDVPALDPCAPTTVKKRSESLVVVVDDNGGTRKLVGAWNARLHPTVEACREQMQAGAPRVKATGGYIYELAQ